MPSNIPAGVPHQYEGSDASYRMQDSADAVLRQAAQTLEGRGAPPDEQSVFELLRLIEFAEKIQQEVDQRDRVRTRSISFVVGALVAMALATLALVALCVTNPNLIYGSTGAALAAVASLAIGATIAIIFRSGAEARIAARDLRRDRHLLSRAAAVIRESSPAVLAVSNLNNLERETLKIRTMRLDV